MKNCISYSVSFFFQSILAYGLIVGIYYLSNVLFFTPETPTYIRAFVSAPSMVSVMGFVVPKISENVASCVDKLFFNKDDNVDLELKNLEKKVEKNLKSEIKVEIGKVKMGVKYKLEPEKIKEELKFLNHEKNIGKFDLNFQYIQDHIDETESQIMGGMDIEMD